MAIRSTVNPGKPLKLPSTMPNGKRTKLHPLAWCVATKMPEGATKSDLAKHLGVRPQTLYKWLGKCDADRHFSLPAERVSGFAGYFGVDASLFRPDLYQPLKAA